VIKDFYKELVDNLHDGVYFVDRKRVITYWNKGAERLTGYTAAEMIGHRCHDSRLNYITAKGEQIYGNACPLASCMEDGRLRRAEVFVQHADGHRLAIMLRAKPLLDENGEIVGAVESFYNNESVMTTRHQLSEMRRTALMDPLTGISNRRHMEGRLRAVIAEYHYTQISSGVLLIDVDRFKQVNDEFGHDAGDKVLQRVANDLRQNLRTTDMIGRWGGDEFLAILYDVKDSAQLRSIATKLHNIIQYSHIDLENKSLIITISIGATLLHEDDTPKSIVRRADDLMYYSKNVGRNHITVG
jgi:diguanylate cyclase (GGDEF)-like protein/PAS domain S-box-containing protein